MRWYGSARVLLCCTGFASAETAPFCYGTREKRRLGSKSLPTAYQLAFHIAKRGIELADIEVARRGLRDNRIDTLPLRSV